MSIDCTKWEEVKESRSKFGKLSVIIRNLNSGNSLSEESIDFLIDNNIGKEYFRKKGMSEEVIESVWKAMESRELCKNINCNDLLFSSETRIYRKESEE